MFFLALNNLDSQSGFNFRLVWHLLTQELFFSLLFLICYLLLLAVTFLYPLFIPLTFLAILISLVKLAEWTDDRFLDDKIGGWIQSQKFVYLKIIPNKQKISLADMEKFFHTLHAIGGKRTQKNFRTTGKFYEEVTWEIHSEGGEVNWYVRISKGSLNVFLHAAKISFPQVEIVECSDPFENWPAIWKDLEKEYTDLVGTEFKFPKSDLYAIKSLNEIKEENKDQTLEPVMGLLTTLKGLDSEDYLVLQWVLRPMEPNPERWNKELKDLKQEFANNSAVTVNKGGQVQVYTEQEKSIINAAESKLASLCYQTKFRLMILGKKSTGRKYLPGIMSYLKQFATPKQSFAPMMRTWEEDPKSTTWDEVFWKQENRKRAGQIYYAVRNRSLSRGITPQFWSVKDLASLLILPS